MPERRGGTRGARVSRPSLAPRVEPCIATITRLSTDMLGFESILCLILEADIQGSLKRKDMRDDVAQLAHFRPNRVVRRPLALGLRVAIGLVGDQFPPMCVCCHRNGSGAARRNAYCCFCSPPVSIVSIIRMGFEMGGD